MFFNCMQKKSIYKVPDGKLIKISLDFDESSHNINDIQINGDFFVYPEESIQLLEKELVGIIIDRSVINDLIDAFVDKNQIEFIGINAESLTEAIMRCKI